jgi:signal transduction histidine kinase
VGPHCRRINKRGATTTRTEERLAGFTELVGTAIANAQAREELRTIADEQAALRRVATMVAAAAPPPVVFAAVAEEVGRLLHADNAHVVSFDEESATLLAHWGATEVNPVGFRQPLSESRMSRLVHESGHAIRIDDYASVTGGIRDDMVRSGVGAPITVSGRLWGMISVSSGRAESLVPETEARLADFTELAATAISNAQAHADLAASRARIVANADEIRRKIERDLHDGAQQRLVTLAVQLRAAQAAMSPDHDLAVELDHVAAGLNDALDELRELASGIHPPVLAAGGLGPAVRMLARRSAVPVDLHVRADSRLPEPVEVGAYYVVSEALTNVVKHSEATTVEVEVEADDEVLRVRVHDDGVAAPSSPGARASSG